ncbi:uncharacterized protein BJX67DRAFT_40101 [Aspergillus lucknowensis]|uniref:F-box domain-containing protein n=1 Tax=Aspergillus lucknowensis TaxID=176173 RepID=A0ABR4LWD9_9EURO
MLLSALPPEIIYLIATHLPTASALAYLSRTCRRLHEVIASEDWRIFRAFVNGRLLSINTPPFWKDVAQALTARSRALDRHAVIGRFIVHPTTAERVGGSPQATRGDNPTHGYRPVIDSYEIWNGSSWHDRHEVLAWGAGHEVMLQIRQTGPQRVKKSFIFNDLEHISSHDDIRGLHLLRPEHRSKTSNREHLILGRMRGELIHLSIEPKLRTHEQRQRFQTFGLGIERTNMSGGSEPILAAHLNGGAISFYKTTTDEAEVLAFARLQINGGGPSRNRTSKFLSPHRFAVASGRSEDAITISTISQERLSLERNISSDFLVSNAINGLAKRATVTAIEPLNGQTVGDPMGNVFLAAWGDHAVRLHDIRSHKPYEKVYIDVADQNPVYCVHPFGHDRFLLGAGGDAVLKIFDIRMPNKYNYLDARPRTFSRCNGSQSRKKPPKNPPHTNPPSKDLSIFLSFNAPASHIDRPRSRFRHRYRGPIYTMSSPSLLSPTIYTGITGGVLRLDFASTDDITGPEQSWYRDRLDLELDFLNEGPESNSILDLSGYERPDSRDTTTCSKLRTQQPFWAVEPGSIANEQTTGWDRRWKPLDAPGAWRRRD